MSNHKLTKEDLIADWNSGLSAIAIAEKYCVSKQDVINRVSRYRRNNVELVRRVNRRDSIVTDDGVPVTQADYDALVLKVLRYETKLRKAGLL